MRFRKYIRRSEPQIRPAAQRRIAGPAGGPVLRAGLHPNSVNQSGSASQPRGSLTGHCIERINGRAEVSF
jgi:hypothetical protein